MGKNSRKRNRRDERACISEAARKYHEYKSSKGCKRTDRTKRTDINHRSPIYSKSKPTSSIQTIPHTHRTAHKAITFKDETRKKCLGVYTSRYLSSLCGPAFYDHTKCDDDIDCISLQKIWFLDSDGHRTPTGDIDYIFSYLEKWESSKIGEGCAEMSFGRDICRGFSMETMQQLIYKIQGEIQKAIRSGRHDLENVKEFVHPVSRRAMPVAVIDNAILAIQYMERHQIMDKLHIEDLGATPVHLLTSEKLRNLSCEVTHEMFIERGIHVDDNLIVNLSLSKLVFLRSQLWSMVNANFNSSQLVQLNGPGRELFSFDNHIDMQNRNALLQSILRDARQMLQHSDASYGEALRGMLCYVFVGALATVIPSVRCAYGEGLDLDYLSDGIYSSSTSSSSNSFCSPEWNSRRKLQ